MKSLSEPHAANNIADLLVELGTANLRGDAL